MADVVLGLRPIALTVCTVRKGLMRAAFLWCVCAAPLTILLAACATPSIEGKYAVPGQDGMTFEFLKGGTLLVTAPNGQQAEGMWSTIGDDRLKIQMSGFLANLMGLKGICAYRLTSTQLLLTDCGIQGAFTRI